MFGIEKLITSKLHEPGSNKRVFTVDRHIGVVSSVEQTDSLFNKFKDYFLVSGYCRADSRRKTGVYDARNIVVLTSFSGLPYSLHSTCKQSVESLGTKLEQCQFIRRSLFLI